MGAVFTMRLKDVLRTVKADVDSGVGIGLDLYPIFDEDYRAPLNRKIVQHYWNREIGRETIEDFRFALMRTMNEIMPMYNQLYESTRIKYDPLSTMNISTLSDDSTESNLQSAGSSEQKGDSTQRGLGVNNIFPSTAIQENGTGNYATSGNETTGSSESTGTAEDKRNDKSSGKSTGKSTTTGYTGPASALIQQYRATILNVDMLVVMELNPLYMNIWDNGDTFTESGFIL